MSTQQAHRGERLGLPSSGPGSVAPVERRIAAFVVDCLASALVAALFTATFVHHKDATDALPRNWSLVPFFIVYVVGLPLAARTLGMNLFGLRVIRVDKRAPVTPWDALIRTILLALLIPAVIWDRDRRGLHDRVARTVVVRA